MSARLRAAKRDQAEKEMTTPINTFQDILDAIERDPALRDELRRHILGDELLQLPAQFRVFLEAVADMRETLNRMEKDIDTLREEQHALREDVSGLKTDVTGLKTDVSDLKEGQQAIRADVEDLKEGQQAIRTDVARMGGDVSRLAGTDYEAYASRLARRRIFSVMKIPGAQIFSTAKNPEPLRALADEALEAGAVDEPGADDLELADAVLVTNRTDGAAVYILGEISITAQQEDFDKAKRRTTLLRAATGLTCLPVVLTQRVEEGVNTDGVTVLIIEPERERSGDS